MLPPAVRPLRLAVIASFALAACGRPGPEQVQAWKQAQQGDRLVAALKDAKGTPAVRGAAALALVELGWADRVQSAVAAMPIEERAGAIPAVVAALTPVLRAADADRAWGALEALFALRPHATTEATRKQVDAALFPAAEERLRAGRTEGGRRTLQEMLTATGADAVPLVHKLLDDSAVPFQVPVAVLDAVGTPQDRARGGAGLVKRARGQGRVPEPLWKALGTLGGPDVVAYLGEKVTAGGPEDVEGASQAMAAMRREPALLPLALQVAGQPARPEPVRERMIDVAEKVGSEEAQKGLTGLIARVPEPALRYRAFRAALKAGRGKVLLPALEAFPAAATYTPQEIDKEMVGAIYELGWENREGLFRALESRSPFARMAAVLTLERSGLGSDADQVAKLSRDRGQVRGFPPGRTIGVEASRVAALLKKQG